MTDPTGHLPGIEASQLPTSRLSTHVLYSGPQHGEPVLFLHGNLSSSTFWEEAMLALPDRFRAIAPDLRGYGLSDSSVCIDATRGVADWSDDAIALADELGCDRFHLVAHSLGGSAAWALLGAHSSRIASATLVAPGPPCGFGGTCGATGQLNHPDGAGSGAGLIHPTLVQRLETGERSISDELFSPRAVMNRLYWKPPFRPAREEHLLTAMLQVHLGESRYPGNWHPSLHWPGFAPGDRGPINALAPLYNRWALPQLLEAPNKPRLLWIYGEDDPIIRDESMSDVGFQGKRGLRSNWPGEEVFPPQPLLSQVKHALEQYELTGGMVARLTIPDVGHTPYLEQPAKFYSALIQHLESD